MDKYCLLPLPLGNISLNALLDVPKCPLMSLSCGATAVCCVWKYFFQGEQQDNKLIVARDDTHNELPIIRFWRRSAKLYIYLFAPQKELVTLDNDSGVNFLNFSLSTVSSAGSL